MRKRRLKRNSLNCITADQLRSGDTIVAPDTNKESIIDKIIQHEPRRLAVYYNGAAHHYNTTSRVRVQT